MNYTDEEVVEGKKNINDILEEKTEEIIKSFSGNEFSERIKVIDNVIVFMGAAGGTGTSTIVANIVDELTRKMELTVLLIDLNILYPVHHIHFGAKQEIEKPDLVSYLQGKKELGTCITYINKNLSLLYANNRNLIDYVNCSSPESAKTMEYGITNINRLYDLVIVDTPGKIENDVVNTVLYRADIIYSVWNEGISSIINSERMRNNMELTGIEVRNKTKVIFNGRTNIHYNKAAINELKIEVIGILPFEIEIVKSSLMGEIFNQKGTSLSENAAAYCIGISKLAKDILEKGGYID